MKFSSHKDKWLVLLNSVTLFLVIGASILMFLDPTISWTNRLIVLFFCWVPCFFMLHIWFGTSYTMTEQQLSIRSGFIRKEIPFSEVKSATRSRNPLASPALSLKRIEIKYGVGGYTLISPENQDEFLRMLQTRCPNAKID